MNNLTALEIQVLNAFPLNYDNAEDEAMDNATYAGVKEISETTKLEISTIKGVVGSLVKKGLVHVDSMKGGAPDCIVLSDSGIDAVYSL